MEVLLDSQMRRKQYSASEYEVRENWSLFRSDLPSLSINRLFGYKYLKGYSRVKID